MFPCTLFVPFRTFLLMFPRQQQQSFYRAFKQNVSTPTTRTTTTTKLLLGPLSRARGQKSCQVKCSKILVKDETTHKNLLQKLHWNFSIFRVYRTESWKFDDQKYRIFLRSVIQRSPIAIRSQRRKKVTWIKLLSILCFLQLLLW